MSEMHVGKRISELLKRRGVTNREAALWLGISESAVSKLVLRPSQKTEDLFVLSDNMGIPIESFVAQQVRDGGFSTQEEGVPYVVKPKRTLTDCEIALAKAQEQIVSLKTRIDDKDELIQVLKSARV